MFQRKEVLAIATTKVDVELARVRLRRLVPPQEPEAAVAAGGDSRALNVKALGARALGMEALAAEPVLRPPPLAAPWRACARFGAGSAPACRRRTLLSHLLAFKEIGVPSEMLNPNVSAVRSRSLPKMMPSSAVKVKRRSEQRPPIRINEEVHVRVC